MKIGRIEIKWNKKKTRLESVEEIMIYHQMEIDQIIKQQEKLVELVEHLGNQ